MEDRYKFLIIAALGLGAAYYFVSRSSKKQALLGAEPSKYGIDAYKAPPRTNGDGSPPPPTLPPRMPKSEAEEAQNALNYFAQVTNLAILPNSDNTRPVPTVEVDGSFGKLSAEALGLYFGTIAFSSYSSTEPVGGSRSAYVPYSGYPNNPFSFDNVKKSLENKTVGHSASTRKVYLGKDKVLTFAPEVLDWLLASYRQRPTPENSVRGPLTFNAADNLFLGTGYRAFRRTPQGQSYA